MRRQTGAWRVLLAAVLLLPTLLTIGHAREMSALKALGLDVLCLTDGGLNPLDAGRPDGPAKDHRSGNMPCCMLGGCAGPGGVTVVGLPAAESSTAFPFDVRLDRRLAEIDHRPRRLLLSSVSARGPPLLRS